MGAIMMDWQGIQITSDAGFHLLREIMMVLGQLPSGRLMGDK